MKAEYDSLPNEHSSAFDSEGCPRASDDGPGTKEQTFYAQEFYVYNSGKLPSISEYSAINGRNCHTFVAGYTSTSVTIRHTNPNKPGGGNKYKDEHYTIYWQKIDFASYLAALDASY